MTTLTDQSTEYAVDRAPEVAAYTTLQRAFMAGALKRLT